MINSRSGGLRLASPGGPSRKGQEILLLECTQSNLPMIKFAVQSQCCHDDDL